MLPIISLDMDVDLKLTPFFWPVHNIWVVTSLEIICDKVFLINLPVEPSIYIICSCNIVTKNIMEHYT